MKRTLLACCATAALVGWQIRPAHALFGMGDIVFDPVGFAEQQLGVADQVTEIGNQVEELAKLDTEIQQGLSLVNAATHVTSLSSAMGVLSMSGIQMPLPVNVGAVQGLMSGGPVNLSSLGQVGSLYNSSYSANHIYTPTGTDPNSLAIQANANSIAGVQGLAGSLYQAMADRLNNISGLKARLSASKDVKDAADINAEIAYQQHIVEAQQGQIQALGVMASEQNNNEQQQRVEQRQKDIDAVLSDARAQGYYQ